ncbi:MAG TPA: hypothetical protein VKX16_06470 [Chloroflexota bacterium]|nr:hypothetical protein [Chloroflexota bacterium]
MRRSVMLLAVLLLAGLPVGRTLAASTQATSPTLSWTTLAGYQLAVSGTGWPAGAAVTLSLVKGSVVQSVQVKPTADGTFEVGMNHVNQCGILMVEARDGAGDQAQLHSPAMMCPLGANPPPVGTATFAVVKGQEVGSAQNPPTQAQLIAAYFKDLNAHHYRQARRLEATCATTVSLPTATGRMRIVLGAAGTSPMTVIRSKRFVRAAHITSVKRVANVLTAAATYWIFRVGGTFTFAYPAATPAAQRLTSGRQQLTVIVRSCGGTWQIDPNWDTVTLRLRTAR